MYNKMQDIENIHYIYYLHYGDDVPFYVGKTNNPINRKNIHKNKLKQNVELIVIDQSNNKDWRWMEEFYIQIFRSWGFNLSNGFKGGGGACYWTEEQKQNPIRRSKLSKPKPLGFGDKIKQNRNHKDAGRKSSISNQKHYIKGSERNIKISQKLKGRKVDWTGNPILQFDIQGNFIQEWPSIRQAGFSLVGNQGEPIRKCLKGLQKTAYGYIWKPRE
jgi:hypothetical protein